MSVESQDSVARHLMLYVCRNVPSSFLKFFPKVSQW